MPEYQNFFTRVQVETAPSTWIPVPESDFERVGKPRLVYWFGKFGELCPTCHLPITQVE